MEAMAQKQHEYLKREIEMAEKQELVFNEFNCKLNELDSKTQIQENKLNHLLESLEEKRIIREEREREELNRMRSK